MNPAMMAAARIIAKQIPKGCWLEFFDELTRNGDALLEAIDNIPDDEFDALRDEAPA